MKIISEPGPSTKTQISVSNFYANQCLIVQHPPDHQNKIAG